MSGLFVGEAGLRDIISKHPVLNDKDRDPERCNLWGGGFFFLEISSKF